MKKALAAFAAVIMTIFSFAQPAQAAVYKTTVSISVPKFVAAGIPITVDVTVCPVETRTATACLYSDDRMVTLFANKKKVAAKLSDGLASFVWTPATAGKYTLTASAAAIPGFKVAASAATVVTVGKKTTKTPLTMQFCDSETCEATPMTMYFDDPAVQMSALVGKVAAIGKGRTAHAQFINTKNTWYTFATAKTAFNSEFAQYSADFSMESSSDGYCDNGDETYNWTYRIIVDGTSKYAPVASAPTDITFDCGGGSGSSSSITVSDNYSDQNIDSSIDSVPYMDITVLDPDNIGYDLESYYCTNACTDMANWTALETDSGTGDGTYTFNPDWNFGPGTYQFAVDVVPADGSGTISGTSYTITIF